MQILLKSVTEVSGTDPTEVWDVFVLWQGAWRIHTLKLETSCLPQGNADQLSPGAGA